MIQKLGDLIPACAAIPMILVFYSKFVFMNDSLE